MKFYNKRGLYSSQKFYAYHTIPYISYAYLTIQYDLVGCLKTFFNPCCRILWSSVSLEKIKWHISFLHEVSYIQGKVASGTTTFGGMWPVVSIRLQNSSIISICVKNQVIPQFFLHGVSREVKVASGTITFSWAWLRLPLIQSICGILLSSIFWERAQLQKLGAFIKHP